MEWLKWLVGVAIAFGGFALGLLKNSRDNKREAAQEAVTGAVLKQDVEYIKKGIDAIQGDIRDHGEKMDRLSERVTRVEESAKQAHHRIGELVKERVS